MTARCGARRLPAGWAVIRGEPPAAPGSGAAGAPAAHLEATVGATPAASRPPGGVVVRVGLDTYRPLALLAAAALVTPLHPLAYPILLVALGSARRRAHWDGWPFVPGRAGLLAVLTAGLAHDAVAGLTGTPGGLALLAHVPWLWAAPLPLPHWVADALWAATRP